MANGSSYFVNNKCRHHDVINVLTNFLILSDIFIFKYFSLYGYFDGNSDNAMNSTIWRHNVREIYQPYPSQFCDVEQHYQIRARATK